MQSWWQQSQAALRCNFHSFSSRHSAGQPFGWPSSDMLPPGESIYVPGCSWRERYRQPDFDDIWRPCGESAMNRNHAPCKLIIRKLSFSQLFPCELKIVKRSNGENNIERGVSSQNEISFDPKFSNFALVWKSYEPRIAVESNVLEVDIFLQVFLQVKHAVSSKRGLAGSDHQFTENCNKQNSKIQNRWKKIPSTPSSRC